MLNNQHLTNGNILLYLHTATAGLSILSLFVDKEFLLRTSVQTYVFLISNNASAITLLMDKTLKILSYTLPAEENNFHFAISTAVLDFIAVLSYHKAENINDELELQIIDDGSMHNDSNTNNSTNLDEESMEI